MGRRRGVVGSGERAQQQGRGVVGDLEAIDKVQGETAKTVALIANLAEWTPDQVRDLDAADFAAASKAVAEMLGNG